MAMTMGGESRKCSRLINANKRLVQQEREVREALRAVMAWWVDASGDDGDEMPAHIFDKAMASLRANGNKEQAIAIAEGWPSKGLL